MTDRFPSSRDKFQTTIRLPPHRLEFDEERFLRLLCCCPVLKKAEKRKVIEAVPRLRQEQVEELMAIMEAEARFVAADIEHQANWARVRATDEREWKELEREMGN